MYYEYKAVQIAGEMLGGDCGLLNCSLCDLLINTSSIVENAGGVLVSRQAIAVLIQLWLMNNPDKKAYGE